jgi:hypothetical protein
VPKTRIPSNGGRYGLPVVQQVIQLRIQVLLRRVPGFQEKVVDVGFINSADSRIRIGIRSQQSALGFGKSLSRFPKKPHAIHFRHALVCEQKSDAVAAKLQLFQKIKRRLGRIAARTRY